MTSAEKTNGVDEATMMHFIREENSLKAQISALQGKRKNFRSGIKSFGVKLKNFDRVLEQFNAEDGGQEAIDDLREQRRLARLAQIPFGFQFNFFDEKDQSTDKPDGGAYEQGKRAYLALVKESENPFSPNLAQGQDWLKGFREAEAACKVGKDRASAGPQKDGEPEAAKGTLPVKKATGKMAAAGDDSEPPDDKTPKRHRPAPPKKKTNVVSKKAA